MIDHFIASTAESIEIVSLQNQPPRILQSTTTTGPPCGRGFFGVENKHRNFKQSLRPDQRSVSNHSHLKPRFAAKPPLPAIEAATGQIADIPFLQSTDQNVPCVPGWRSLQPPSMMTFKVMRSPRWKEFHITSPSANRDMSLDETKSSLGQSSCCHHIWRSRMKWKAPLKVRTS